MNTMLEAMLTPYEASTLEQRKHALREVVQEIILCGLSRAGFFGPAAFYGGTALRIFYGLDRFSEDMDFSLRQPNETFDLSHNTLHPLLRSPNKKAPRGGALVLPGRGGGTPAPRCARRS